MTGAWWSSGEWSHARRVILMLLASLAAVASLAAPGVADAATYQVHTCTNTVPGAGSGDFLRGGTLTKYNMFDENCGLGGSLKVEQAPNTVAAGDDAGEWQVNRPPGLTFAGVSFGADGVSADDQRPRVITRGSGVLSVVVGTSALTANPVFEYYANASPGGFDQLALQLRCDAGNCPSVGSPSAFAAIKNITFAMDDPAAPSVGSVVGPLVTASGSLRGVAGVGIGGSDAGSGVYVATVHVNGSRVASTGFAGCSVSGGQATRLVPCPNSATALMAVNTANPAFRTGDNRLKLCVADYAGQTDCRAATARVDNVCPDAGATVAKLRRVRFKGGGAGKKATAKTRYGRKVRVRGRAIDAAGNPVAGATICLGQHVAGDRFAAEEVTRTTTGRTGRFRFELQRGPSNDYRVVAWQGASALEEFRTLLVKAKPKLRIKGRARPGRRVRVRVRINPPEVAGKRVKIQAKSNAGWVGVPRCSGHTNSKGRYGCKVRVPKGTGGSRLVFRAVVPRDEGYPYLRGHSRPKSKRVRG